MLLTREKVPGLATAIYLTLTLTCHYYAFTLSPFESENWGMALVILTFPYSFVLSFLFFALGLRGDPPLWFLVWLFLVFTTANAFAVHRVSRNIVGRD